MSAHLWLLLLLAAAPTPSALEAADIQSFTHREELARRALEAGLEESQIASWLESATDWNAHTRKLLEILGEVGTRASMPALWRLAAWHRWGANSAIDRILEREMAASLKECVPPTEAAADRMRERAWGLAPEGAAPGEIADLAYLLAATQSSGPEVGRRREVGEVRMPARGDDAHRDALYRRLEESQTRGELEAAAQAARDYLATLGYPSDLREADETAWTWGGGRHSHVMRALARLDEALGRFEEAADLYRRADPFGGACGTGASHRWADQVAGLIRSEERWRGCAAVVAERLLAVDGTRRGFRRSLLGPERLAEAGFDVERLFRGALVTAGRPGDDGWEARVYAIEGYADTAGRRAIPKLLELAGSKDVALARRAVEALGALGERRCFPCGGMGMTGTSEWKRDVETLDADCSRPMPDQERDELSRQLVPLAKDGAYEVRLAAVGAIGAIAATTMLPSLEMLARDDTAAPDTCQMSDEPDGPCVPFLGIREEAKEALRRIEGVLEAERTCVDGLPVP